MQSGLQSKNEYILYRSMYNQELHNAVMIKDVQAIEVILDNLTKVHLKNYEFSLYDSNTFIDIEYVYMEHMREIEELEDEWWRINSSKQLLVVVSIFMVLGFIWILWSGIGNYQFTNNRKGCVLDGIR